MRLSLFTRRTGRQWACALAGSHYPSKKGHQETYHPIISHSDLLESVDGYSFFLCQSTSSHGTSTHVGDMQNRIAALFVISSAVVFVSTIISMGGLV